MTTRVLRLRDLTGWAEASEAELASPTPRPSLPTVRDPRVRGVPAADLLAALARGGQDLGVAGLLARGEPVFTTADEPAPLEKTAGDESFRREQRTSAARQRAHRLVTPDGALERTHAVLLDARVLAAHGQSTGRTAGPHLDGPQREVPAGSALSLDEELPGEARPDVLGSGGPYFTGAEPPGLQRVGQDRSGAHLGGANSAARQRYSSPAAFLPTTFATMRLSVLDQAAAPTSEETRVRRAGCWVGARSALVCVELNTRRPFFGPTAADAASDLRLTGPLLAAVIPTAALPLLLVEWAGQLGGEPGPEGRIDNLGALVRRLHGADEPLPAEAPQLAPMWARPWFPWRVEVDGHAPLELIRVPGYGTYRVRLDSSRPSDSSTGRTDGALLQQRPSGLVWGDMVTLYSSIVRRLRSPQPTGT